MMKKGYFYGALVSSTLLFTTGCSKTDNLYDPTFGTNTKPASEYFSFETTQTATLQLNYGALAGNALVEVYDHNPVVLNPAEEGEDNGYTIEGEALYKAFLNKEGNINRSITLPAGVKQVWLYSHNWGAPQLVEPKFNNGVISYNVSSTRAVQTRGELNKLSDNITCIDRDFRNFFALVKWGQFGKVDKEKDINGLYSEGDLTPEIISSIQQFYLDENNNKKDNSQYFVDTDKGNIYLTESVQLWMTLVNESTSQQPYMGYFFYYIDEDGTMRNYEGGAKINKYDRNTYQNVEKFIIVPNYSIAGSAPYNKTTLKWNGNNFTDYTAKEAPATNGTRVQLLFKDKDGNFKAEFPKGYHVGFFVNAGGNAFTPKVDQADGCIENIGTGTTYFTFTKWNDGNSRFTCLRLNDGSLVYGCESGTDKSGDDVVFMVSSNNNSSFENGDKLPTIPVSVAVPDANQNNYSTYAFEDMWPSGGDYDLNDVMVEHTSKVTSNTSDGKEYVKKVEDTFTFVQPANAATYTDAFAVKFDAAQRGDITLPEGAIDETETGAIIICENTKANLKKSFTVTRTFSENTLLKENLKTDIDPFILSQYKAGDAKRVEVHLPKHNATSKADESKKNHGEDAYFIDKDGKYPFAISIPMKDFIPATEKSPISVEYTGFDKWVKTNGAEDADWYKHFTKKQ